MPYFCTWCRNRFFFLQKMSLTLFKHDNGVKTTPHRRLCDVMTSHRRRYNVMTPPKVVCLLGKHYVYLTGLTSRQGQYGVVYRSGISTQDDLKLAQFLQEGIDVSGYNGQLDGNDGRYVNGLKFCFPMSLALMLACLMEGIVCGVGMEKDSLSVALNNVTDGVVAVS